MNVFRNISEFTSDSPTVVTIGTFDGVHAGHRKILTKVSDLSKVQNCNSVLLTLWPHPKHVLFPDINIELLNSLDERLEHLENAGLQNVVVHPFTKEFSRLTATEYVRDVLVTGLKAKYVVIGYDHRFGRNREGSFEDLKELSQLYDFEVVEISAEEIEGVQLSSTKIRKALRDGDIATANRYLGYEYALLGTVVEGNQLGRSIGFPTANLALNEPDKLVPKDGSYAVKVLMGQLEYGGMMNIGVRPTVDGERRTIEVNIFDFDDVIYGKEVKLVFYSRIRDEVRFTDLDQLREQLGKDRLRAEEILKS